MSLHFIKNKAKVGFGKDKEMKFVGRRRLADPLTLERLAKEVSLHTGQPVAQCEITLRYMADAIGDAMLDGRSVDIGIGTISPAISTKASDTADGVKVVRKRPLFRASVAFRKLVEKVSLKLITDEDDGTTDTAPDTPDPAPHNGGSCSGSGDTGGGLGA